MTGDEENEDLTDANHQIVLLEGSGVRIVTSEYGDEVSIDAFKTLKPKEWVASQCVDWFFRYWCAQHATAMVHELDDNNDCADKVVIVGTQVYANMLPNALGHVNPASTGWLKNKKPRESQNDTLPLQQSHRTLDFGKIDNFFTFFG